MVVVAREYFHAQKCGVMRQISGCYCLCDFVVVGNGWLGVAGHDANKVRCVCSEVDCSGGVISVVKWKDNNGRLMQKNQQQQSPRRAVESWARREEALRGSSVLFGGGGVHASKHADKHLLLSFA